MATKSVPLKANTKASTSVAVKKPGANIVAIQEQLKKQALAISERTAPAGGDKIQVMKEKEFKLPDGSTAESLEVVIVDFISTHNYYEGKYDPKNIVPPNCFAIGINPLAMIPSNKSPDKQADNCQTCPLNQWGSDGNGKACKNGRRLAVLPPDADAETPLMILDVSPTGIKSFDAYVNSVAGKFALPPMGVVTTVTFDQNADYASLRFGNPQPNTNLDVAFARAEEAATRLKQEPDVSGFESKPKKKVAGKR
jgi:hypothetical protein